MCLFTFLGGEFSWGILSEVQYHPNVLSLNRFSFVSPFRKTRGFLFSIFHYHRRPPSVYLSLRPPPLYPRFLNLDSERDSGLRKKRVTRPKEKHRKLGNFNIRKIRTLKSRKKKKGPVRSNIRKTSVTNTICKVRGTVDRVPVSSWINKLN